MIIYVFEVKEVHLKLLQRLRLMEERYIYEPNLSYIGTSLKRPFGNSDTLDDIAEILEWEVVRGLSEQQENEAIKIFNELIVALHISLSQLKFEAGVYFAQSNVCGLFEPIEIVLHDDCSFDDIEFLHWKKSNLSYDEFVAKMKQLKESDMKVQESKNNLGWNW